MSKILFGGYLQGLTVFNPFFSAAFQKHQVSQTLGVF